jgi:hypothetical protein
MFGKSAASSIVFLILMCAALDSGCTPVPKNPNDSTLPSVEIDVQDGNGNYVPV